MLTRSQSVSPAWNILPHRIADSVSLSTTRLAHRLARALQGFDTGDVNGDGVDDVIVSASIPAAGYVVFGSTQGFPPVFLFRSLYPDHGGDGSRGFVLTSTSGPVSKAGDVNADGIDDLIMGTDRTHVLFGSTARFPAVLSLSSLYPPQGGDGSAGFVLIGDPDDESGRSLSAAGDVNADGIDDVILGAPFASQGDEHLSAGESYVVFGSAEGFPAIMPLARLFPAAGGDGSRGIVFVGVNRNDTSGRSVSGAGDVNGDGIDDVIIGAYQADPGAADAGESYVVFGRAAAP